MQKKALEFFWYGEGLSNHSDEKQATSNCDLLKSIDNILYLVPQRYIGKHKQKIVCERISRSDFHKFYKLIV